MNCNYVKLNQYNKSSENFVQYNVGKFEVSRRKSGNNYVYNIINYSDISTSPSGILKTDGSLEILADKICDGCEIKSVDLFMKYGNIWSLSGTPFINQYLSYSPSSKTITLSKPSMAFTVQSGLKAGSSPEDQNIGFARFYITWGPPTN